MRLTPPREVRVITVRGAEESPSPERLVSQRRVEALPSAIPLTEHHGDTGAGTHPNHGEKPQSPRRLLLR